MAVAAMAAFVPPGTKPAQVVVADDASPRPRRYSRLNRSRHWDYAETYKEARAMSPFPHRPVR